MKLTAILISLLAVLIVSLFFISRKAAIIRANDLMSPAIAEGWSNFETRLTFTPKSGRAPVWWVRYELKGSFFQPHSVYVDLRGEVDDWEVREMLNQYSAAKETSAGQPENIRVPIDSSD